MNRRFGAGVVLVVAAALLAAQPARAQDTHYWYEQFGNRALLLSGAVVGDPADLSAVYYNPGGLALRAPELLLAGLVLNISGNTISDVLAGGGDVTTRDYSLAPSLIAGEINLGDSSRSRFAYSLLTRFDSALRTTARVQLDGADVGFPELNVVANAVSLDNRLTEYWAGGTWAYQLRPQAGFGISTFLAVRNQRAFNQNAVQALSSAGRAAVVNVADDYKYYNVRVLWKLGFATKFQDWDLGLAVTTPSVSMFGSGATATDRTAVGQRLGPDGTPIAEIATDGQSGLKADYRSPLSIAVGAARSFDDWVVHVSAEYFAGVGAYTVIDSQPFQSQSSGRSINTAVVQELDPVLNVAVGVERVFNPGLKGYLGFHTDFNAASDNPRANLSLTKWDFYHVSGGATFAAMGTDLTLGADAAVARNVIELPANGLTSPIGFAKEAAINSFKLTVLLGFSFDFR